MNWKAYYLTMARAALKAGNTKQAKAYRAAARLAT